MWVFWIHASNAARFEQGYQQIATVAEIPGRDDPKTNVLQLVYHWLCDARNGGWLVVLDNADDDIIFFRCNGSNERWPLMSLLPQAAHGSILITSRNGRAARNLVGSDGHVIEVQPMNEEESHIFLRARIPASQSGESEEDEKALVQTLEYIPLAITQAAAYTVLPTGCPFLPSLHTLNFSMKASQNGLGFSRMRIPRISGAIPASGMQ